MKILIYYIVFIVAYVLLSATTAMYFMTWGAQRNVFEKLYVLIIAHPFDWGRSIWLLPINAIFWATILLLVRIGSRKFFSWIGR